MSQPRAIVAGATYLITRRVLRRHFLFRPDAKITQLLVYALAVSARRYDIQVHALCAMSTHLHLVVTDTNGVLPRFLQFFHRIVALGTKILRTWEGPVWDPEATSVVRLWTRAAMVEKIAYAIANPVAAGLVRRAREWPGAHAHAQDVTDNLMRAKRPAVYFDATNPNWPADVTLPLTLPPGLEPDHARAFCRDVAAEIERLEAHAYAEALQRGHKFLGPARVCNVSPYDRATSHEALGQRNPTFAVGRDQGGAWRRAVEAVHAFRGLYRRALEQWRDGVREATFPAGTWWMRVFHRVSVSELILGAELTACAAATA